MCEGVKVWSCSFKMDVCAWCLCVLLLVMPRRTSPAQVFMASIYNTIATVFNKTKHEECEIKCNEMYGVWYLEFRAECVCVWVGGPGG